LDSRNGNVRLGIGIAWTAKMVIGDWVLVLVGQQKW